VIVAGPNLKLHQCGLPKLMALELFKPFIMSRLVERKSVQNIKAAKKYVESMAPEVWDVLEEVIAEHPVLLNRAPTLHRLGIQAFEPVLVEGKAIQIHPLVCHAFNADFDGDQMAVHLPLSAEAQAEARVLMLSANNILSPAHGKPLATPTQDMVLGAYYLTYCTKDLPSLSAEELDPRPKRFRTEDEVILALEAKQEGVGLQEPIEYRWNGELILTTPGRVILNEEISRSLEVALGDEYDRSRFPFHNRTLGKREMSDLMAELVDEFGAAHLSIVLDTVKELGFDYATKAGITISKNDIVIPPNKEEILETFEEQVQGIERNYERGLITEDERHEAIVQVWTEATDSVADAMEDHMWELNPIYMMANSGARGSFKQIRQLAGMRGLMANPKGEIIERPIKANFMEGLSVLEYFISTHGARKGLADTALRTADSGYLTRRLVDVSQDVIVREEDCGTNEHIALPLVSPEGGLNRSLTGRLLAEDVHKPLKDGKPGKTVLAEKDEITSMKMLKRIHDELGESAQDFTIPVRSVLTCKSEFGVCRSCYGVFLATDELCEIGDAVGIIAAQSIGEPGTQLTMRTFHTGGVAGADITQGLPRVVEIFEARNPKGAAKLAEIGGRVVVEQTDRGPKVTIVPAEAGEDGELGEVSYQLPRRTRLLVADGDVIEPGDALHDGSRNPAELLKLKGATPTELYLVDEVQRVYKSQGVEIHDKHIELILRQMLKKVRVETPGDTELLPGELTDRSRLEKENERVSEEGGELATYEPLILGITKASLATESFLSAASFQETTKVLTDAAIEGKRDRLLGLKENVIIGKLIPAATGLKKYRTLEISPTEKVPVGAYARPQTEEQLLAALEEIGSGDAELSPFDLGLDGDGASGNGDEPATDED
jgi:DNA-directed RNA polymerase subunit beta'